VTQQIPAKGRTGKRGKGDKERGKEEDETKRTESRNCRG